MGIRRRQVVWTGLFVTVLGGLIWSALARRPRELAPLSPPVLHPVPAVTP